MIALQDRVDATPAALVEMQSSLCGTDAPGARAAECAWAGRGATALVWAYEIAKQLRPDVQLPEIIVPSSACASVAATAIAAGCTPRFADVSASTALSQLQHVQARKTDATVGVLFVHLYGNTADLAPLQAWCEQHKLTLIEDCAQALGARLPDGNAVGSVGDLAVYSFSPTKILEAGGGCLVARGDSRTQLSSVVRPVAASLSLDERRELSLSFRNLHHGLMPLIRLGRIDGSVALLNLVPHFTPLFFAPFQTTAALAQAWPTLQTNLAHRRRIAEVYDEGFAGLPVQILSDWQASGVSWRYSILVADHRTQLQVVKGLRAAGFLASNHYFPLHPLFGPEDRCENARDLGQRLVNLWVDGKATVAGAQKTVETVRRLLAERGGAAP